MSLVANKLISVYKSLLENADSRTEDYFLMRSPTLITIILTFYLIFVLKLGPALMKNRSPINLDKIILIYNWSQIFINATFFIVTIEIWPNLNIFCTPVDNSPTYVATKIVDLHYSYFLLKVLDLLDTIFYILRKKNNQVTFLHLYHHVSMSAMTWVTLKFWPGGQLFFLGIPNMLVHTVMYFYYFLTNWKQEYKRNIWWKKYITQLQILQHCCVFTFFVLPLLNPHCSYPKPLLAALVVLAAVMIYLFVDFYVKAYIKKKPKSQ